MNDDDTFTISIGDSTYTNTSTIDISNITTVTDSDYTFNIDDISSGDVTFTTDIKNSTYDWSINDYIDPEEVERMCKEYPALAKVWQNFKSVYDMVQQDYKGKKEAGEIDDNIPF